jgi:hypothetical protein
MTDRPAEVTRLSWAEVCARRLERHALSAPSHNAQPADIANAICGAHAQVLSAAELSIALRITGATRSTVRQALWNKRSLVKTFGPRGTVHLLATRDLPLWTGALSAIPPSASPFPKDVRLTPEQTDEIVGAIAVSLEDAELSIDELSEAVIAATGAWAGELVMPAFQGMWPRWRQALSTAANRGALCFGPNRGRNVTYTNPHRWLPGFRPTGGQTALAQVARRYLHAYGPATLQQFAQWLAAPRGWATALFDSLADELQHVEVNGTLACGRGHDRVGGAEGPPAAALLRRLHRRLPAARTALPRPRRRTRPGRRPGRELSGAAHRRDGRRGVAPAPVRLGNSTSPWSFSTHSPPVSAASSTTRCSASGKSSKANPS